MCHQRTPGFSVSVGDIIYAVTRAGGGLGHGAQREIWG